MFLDDLGWEHITTVRAAIVSAANVVTGILNPGVQMDLCEVICPFFELRSTQEQEG